MRLGQIAMSVLAESEGMVGAVQRTLQIGQHHVDPARIGLLAPNIATGLGHRMGMLVLQHTKGA